MTTRLSVEPWTSLHNWVILCLVKAFSVPQFLYHLWQGYNFRSSDVFKICGSLQFLSGLSLLIGLLSFPAGWDNDEVRGVCGPQADDYKLGNCGIRWAFALAIIALFDTVILGFLAYTLATKKIKMMEEPAYMNPSSMYHGEINPGFMGDNLSIAGSRKSGGLQPVMLMPHGPIPDER